MLNLIKILAAAFVLLGFGAALMKMPDDGGSAGGSGFSLFKDLPSEPKAPKKAKKPPPSSDPQAVTCSEDGQQCWFTDQGQPNR